MHIYLLFIAYTNVSFINRGSFHLPTLKSVGGPHLTGSTPLRSAGSPPDASTFDMVSPRSKDSNVSIKSELSDLDSPDINSNTSGGRKVILTTKTSDKEQNTDRVDVREFATATSKSFTHLVELVCLLSSFVVWSLGNPAVFWMIFQGINILFHFSFLYLSSFVIGVVFENILAIKLKLWKASVLCL